MYICKFPNFGPGINIFEVLAQIPLESVWDKRFNLESNKSVFNKRLHYFKNVHIKKMFTAHSGFACTTSTSLSLFTTHSTHHEIQRDIANVVFAALLHNIAPRMNGKTLGWH